MPGDGSCARLIGVDPGGRDDPGEVVVALEHPRHRGFGRARVGEVDRLGLKRSSSAAATTSPSTSRAAALSWKTALTARRNANGAP